MIINRFSAFSIHLVLSVLVFMSLVAVMYFYWFPGELFFMDGGYEGIKLVAMVDLVLGPLLTLLLFKRGKPTLVFDMSVVAFIQVAALSYGFYATYNQRIVAMVYADNRFNTLTIAEYDESSELLRAKGIEPKPLDRFGEQAPINVFTRPFTADTYPAYLESIFNDYPGVRERSDMYLGIKESYQELSDLQLTSETLEQAGLLQRVEQLLAKNNRRLDDVELYPLKARYESGLAVFDPSVMRIIDILRDDGFAGIEKNRMATRAEE